ncbi:SH3 domain-containing protein [Nitrospirillum viridazoti]|uniref:SH3-like domain-containing protein n=1 Tax=Nitrospirillum amazonense TaxID=28077 RepID=A0A560I6K2_9PROT|nr:SH3 domain-containing protein [Nitrospirillum amazonense]TWB54603.1 SH3-like domain-containing protein [Nitrospirillum amazonense]
MVRFFRHAVPLAALLLAFAAASAPAAPPTHTGTDGTGAASDQQEAEPQSDAAHPDAVVRSGLPVPRFVTLRSNEVNVRTGPGVRYPVEWVFVKAGMPVEITAEFDTWRRIRDVEGTQGWVHQSTLSGRRGIIVTGQQSRTLRRDAASASEAVAQLDPGVIAKLRKCKGPWCQVDVGGFRGWLQRDEVWGVYPKEEVGE